MSFKFFAAICLAIVLGSALTGCLTAEHKETRIKLNPDGKSGSGVVVFTNISSEPGDSADVSKDDFNSLITEYYQGRKIETENKGMKNVKKRLYKIDGKLMGEVSFEFDDVYDIGFFRYKDSGPLMYYTVAEGFFTSGQYEASNGSYAGEKMPVIFWDSNAQELYFKMALSTPQEVRRPLATLYQDWESGQK
ncbi:MAG: hypothetical protein ABI444_04700 [Candidatus Kapaibacterium sp.]|jgi:hypothetical protein